MQLSFHYLWEDDLDTASKEIATILQSTMASSPLRTLRYGAIPPDEFLSWLTKGVRADLEEQKKHPRIRWIDSKIGSPDVVRWEDIVIKDEDLASLVVANGQASESNTRIVAHAAFMYHPPGDDAASIEVGHHGTDKEPNPLPASGNRQLQEYFNAKVEQALKAEFAGMHCFEVRELNVLGPDYWRKGIASRLLDWIIPKADKKNIPIVLAATPPGYPLYLKHGFVEIEGGNRIVECDMSEWGGIGIHRHVLMIRYPKAMHMGAPEP
jgi:GNAT superfamily N-acetyltransferase